MWKILWKKKRSYGWKPCWKEGDMRWRAGWMCLCINVMDIKYPKMRCCWKTKIRCILVIRCTTTYAILINTGTGCFGDSRRRKTQENRLAVMAIRHTMLILSIFCWRIVVNSRHWHWETIVWVSAKAWWWTVIFLWENPLCSIWVTRDRPSRNSLPRQKLLFSGE